MDIAIVAVGYNRPNSMKRLLNSLCMAKYDKKCDLIISLDYGKDQSTLVDIAKTVVWQHGDKKIRAFKENLGLRKHIIKCGDLTQEYDAVIVLEDDLIVAEGFFNYVTESVEFYKDNDQIAGISLYTHRTNPGNGRPFEAQYNGFDTFLMQYAQSWGQCWTKKMWKGFKAWYEMQDELYDDGIIPRYVTQWNKQSWLKYYIRYTAEKGLYYVYPYFSLTTNNTEVGEHNKESSSAYHVPLVSGDVKNYRFPEINQAVKYDSYFERIFDESTFNNKITVLDLYGLRTVYGKASRLYSTAVLDYKIIKEIDLRYRPHELNILMQENGEGIYLYDLTQRRINKKKNSLSIVSYDLKAEDYKLTLIYGLAGLKKRLVSICKKILNKV